VILVKVVDVGDSVAVPVVVVMVVVMAVVGVAFVFILAGKS
jgi:hypothetical protein